MTWWSRLKRLPPWERRKEDREFDAELESITEMAAEDLGSAYAARRALGANTAIFSLIDAVLVRTLPVHEPERLVVFFDGNSVSLFTWAQFNARSGDWMAGVFATTSAVFQDVDLGGGPMRGLEEAFRRRGLGARPHGPNPRPSRHGRWRLWRRYSRGFCRR
ncbi:MAG TPA: hypothetical protein VLH09_02110 [Bryobacteraceae bacterium]|nr:hypothetical protein [Bryobacteraceae bacterium]